MQIHRDLLAIIYAYCGIQKRPSLVAISGNSWKLCSSYTYIISFGNLLETMMYGCRFGWYELVENCLSIPGFNPAEDNNITMRYSIAYGNLDICRLLSADSRINSQYSFKNFLIEACIYGDLEIVRFLLGHPGIDPSHRGGDALTRACQHGHLEIVKLLLTDNRVHISNWSFRGAVLSGHENIIEFLMEHPRLDLVIDVGLFSDTFSGNRINILKLLINNPRIDVSIDDNRFISDAYLNGCHQIVELLLTDTRVQNSLPQKRQIKYRKFVDKVNKVQKKNQKKKSRKSNRDSTN